MWFLRREKVKTRAPSGTDQGHQRLARIAHRRRETPGGGATSDRVRVEVVARDRSPRSGLSSDRQPLDAGLGGRLSKRASLHELLRERVAPRGSSQLGDARSIGGSLPQGRRAIRQVLNDNRAPEEGGDRTRDRSQPATWRRSARPVRRGLLCGERIRMCISLRDAQKRIRSVDRLGSRSALVHS